VFLLRGPRVDRLQVNQAPLMIRLVFPFDISTDRKDIWRDKEKIFAFAETLLTDQEVSNAKGHGHRLFFRTPRLRGEYARLRASEQPQPMAPNHFLRTAGHSAREVADEGSTEGGINELLAFMYGEITESMMNDSPSLVRTARRRKSNR